MTRFSGRNATFDFASVVLFAGLVSVSLCAPAARAASSQIQNKTVVVTYSHYVPATCADGATHLPARNVKQQIYVSSQGRAFAKVSGRAGNATRERMVEPGSGGTFHVSGNQIIGTFPRSAARPS